jgi:hypothetical protein
MSLARIAHVRPAADGLYCYMDMLAERISQHIQRAAGIRGIVAIPAARRALPQRNMPSEAVMRIGSVIVIVWLIIGAIAAGQRHYYSSSDPDCARAGTIIVTVLAGPLNYTGVNPKVSCKTPQPSK